MYWDSILRKDHSYNLGALGALMDFRQVVSISIDQMFTRVIVMASSSVMSILHEFSNRSLRFPPL